MAIFTSVKLLNEKTDLFLLRAKIKSNKGRLGAQYEEETAHVEVSTWIKLSQNGLNRLAKQ